MLPWSTDLAGRIDEHVITSELLRDNPLGDPNERPLLVYVPPGYDDNAGRRYPSVYVIQGYTGHVAMWGNRSPYRQPFPETADAVFARGEAPPAIVVYVDAWTAYGGSQFVDSPGTGRYHSYLCNEVVPWVDQHYRTQDGAAHRAIMGKSSGGFGAMITPMLRPDLFGALASHAGDSLYEYCYIPEFAKSARNLRDYDGDIWRWWDDFRSRVPFTKPEDHELLMLLGVSACFSARDDGSVDLPIDGQTGSIRPDVWQRWLDWDPVRMAPKYADALRSLQAAWIDAGTRDEWFLDLGAQAFRGALRDVGVPDERVHFELFDAGHMGIDYRYPLSLAWLCQRIDGGARLLRPGDVSPFRAGSLNPGAVSYVQCSWEQTTNVNGETLCASAGGRLPGSERLSSC
jgi:S-formylglutathione hydrolase FrmB